MVISKANLHGIFHWGIVVRYNSEKVCLYEAHELGETIVATYTYTTLEELQTAGWSEAGTIIGRIAINENDAKLFCLSFTAENRPYIIWKDNCQTFVTEFITKFDNGKLLTKVLLDENDGSEVIFSILIGLLSLSVTLFFYSALCYYFKFEESLAKTYSKIFFLCFVFILYKNILLFYPRTLQNLKIPRGYEKCSYLCFMVEFVVEGVCCYHFLPDPVYYFHTVLKIIELFGPFKALTTSTMISYLLQFLLLFLYNGAQIYVTIFIISIALYIRVCFKWLSYNSTGNFGKNYKNWHLFEFTFTCFFMCDCSITNVFIYYFTLVMGFDRFCQLLKSQFDKFDYFMLICQVMLPILLLFFEFWPRANGYLHLDVIGTCYSIFFFILLQDRTGRSDIPDFQLFPDFRLFVWIFTQFYICYCLFVNFCQFVKRLACL